MDLATEENSEYSRVAAVLKEIGKESFLNVFKENELTLRSRVRVATSELTLKIP